MKLCPDCEKDVPDEATECPNCHLDLPSFAAFDRIATAREKKRERERKEAEVKEEQKKKDEAKKKKSPGLLESWGIGKKKEE